jgi:tetratricopeptide (TPR) repeat protein
MSWMIRTGRVRTVDQMLADPGTRTFLLGAFLDFDDDLDTTDEEKEARLGLAAAMGGPEAVVELSMRGLAREPGSHVWHGGAAAGFVDLERFEEAETHAERALAARPDSAIALEVRGKVQFKRGDFTKAMATFEKVLDRTANCAEIGLKLVECWERCGKTREEVSLLLDSHPAASKDDTEFDTLRGMMALRCGRLPQAVSALEKACRHEDVPARVRLMLARARVLAGDSRGALRAAEEALKDEESAEGLVVKAGVLATLGESREIPGLLRRAVRLEPRDIVANTMLAQCEFEGGEPNKAKRHLLAAARALDGKGQARGPGLESPLEMVMAGQLALDLEDPATAARFFGHAETLGGGDERTEALILRGRAMAALLAGDHERAGEATAELSRRWPADLGARRLRLLHLERPGSEDWRAESERMVSEFPGPADRFRIAETLARGGKLDEAGRLLEMVIDGAMASPEDVARSAVRDAFVELEGILEDQGREKERLAMLRRWCDAAPGDAEAWNHLAVALDQGGEDGEARRAWLRGLDAEPDNVAVMSNLAERAARQREWAECSLYAASVIKKLEQPTGDEDEDPELLKQMRRLESKARSAGARRGGRQGHRETATARA